MTPFTIVILICSLAVEHSACQPDTAVDVVQGPKVEDARQCGFLGQATIAATAIAPKEGEEYMKIICQTSGSLKADHTAEASPAE